MKRSVSKSLKVDVEEMEEVDRVCMQCSGMLVCLRALSGVKVCIVLFLLVMSKWLEIDWAAGNCVTIVSVRPSVVHVSRLEASFSAGEKGARVAPVVRAGVAGVDSLQRGQSRVRPPSIELSACSTILVFRWDFSSLFKRGRRGGPPRREGSASLASAPNSTSSCSALLCTKSCWQ